MKTVIKTSIIAGLVMSAISGAHASTISTDDVTDSMGWTQTQINQQNADREDANSANIDKLSGQTNAALDGVRENGANIINLQNADANMISRIDTLENAPKPKDGVNGKDGAQGIQGEKGDKGDTGARGATGATGAAGKNGLNGHDGKDGLNGKDAQAYNTYTDDELTNHFNELADAHNENVDTLDKHTAQLDQIQKHDKKQDEQIRDNDKKAMAGIAGALAQTGLHYTDSVNSLASGVGTYDGESAVAIGYSHQWGNRVRFSVQNSVDTAHNVGASASVAIGW